MRLSRLGSFHQTRLSFMRVLLRRLTADRWSFERSLWRVDQKGVGVAVYTATGPQRSYSLIAFGNDLDPSKRSDRVIAEEWDATFTLFDGTPTEADIERLKINVPKQEAGRIGKSELSLSRANRSVRLFDYVREQLSKGMQPEQSELDSVGYLMRTTAVYGSGKFGALDRRFICDREEFDAPFQNELMAVFMIRAFSTDIVEHLAKVDSPTNAVPLDSKLKRRLGIGNSTGLGMAPFVVNHPVLLNQWILARETALARVRSVVTVSEAKATEFSDVLHRQIIAANQWETEHPYQLEKIDGLRDDLQRLRQHLETTCRTTGDRPWDRLFKWAETHLSLEGQECLVTMLLEPYPQLVDDLAAQMSIDEQAHFAIDGRMSVAQLQALIEKHYEFSSRFDATNKAHNARFWYASEEKLEPRLGQRFEEEGADREHPLAVARDVAALQKALGSLPVESPIAGFLLEQPQHRHAVRRVQQSENHPYAEVGDNLIAEEMLPVDLLRCKLSFFGAVKFDPRSDRWVRITMYQHAPTLEDINDSNAADDWVYPPLQTGHGVPG